MNLEQAQDILAHIVASRVRWGKLYDASDIGLQKLSDALVEVAKGDTNEATELRKSLATANRQNGASNAREAKLKKQIEELKSEVSNLNALVERLSHRGDDQGPTED